VLITPADPRATADLEFCLRIAERFAVLDLVRLFAVKSAGIRCGRPDGTDPSLPVPGSRRRGVRHHQSRDPIRTFCSTVRSAAWSTIAAMRPPADRTVGGS